MWHHCSVPRPPLGTRLVLGSSQAGVPVLLRVGVEHCLNSAGLKGKRQEGKDGTDGQGWSLPRGEGKDRASPGLTGRSGKGRQVLQLTQPCPQTRRAAPAPEPRH